MYAHTGLLGLTFTTSAWDCAGAAGTLASVLVGRSPAAVVGNSSVGFAAAVVVDTDPPHSSLFPVSVWVAVSDPPHSSLFPVSVWVAASEDVLDSFRPTVAMGCASQTAVSDSANSKSCNRLMLQGVSLVIALPKPPSLWLVSRVMSSIKDTLQ
jgi:hypothetical protein